MKRNTLLRVSTILVGCICFGMLMAYRNDFHETWQRVACGSGAFVALFGTIALARKIMRT